MRYRLGVVTTNDGVRLRTVEAGSADSAGPTIVLLHGWTVDHRLWRRQIIDLQKRLPAPVRILAYDMRGHGRSSSITRDGATLQRLADDLAAVVSQRTTGPVVLAGHSLGGMTIFEYAHRHQEQFDARVAGAVLVSTSAEGHAHTHYGLPPQLAKVVRLAEVGGAGLLARAGSWTPHRALMPRLAPLVRWLVFGDEVRDDVLHLTTRMISRAPLVSIGGFRPTVGSMNRVAALERFRTLPVAILVGERDRLTPTPCTGTMKEALPDALLRELPGCGHMLPMECPDAVTDAILTVYEAAITYRWTATPSSSSTKPGPSADDGVCAPGAASGRRRTARRTASAVRS